MQFPVLFAIGAFIGTAYCDSGCFFPIFSDCSRTVVEDGVPEWQPPTLYGSFVIDQCHVVHTVLTSLIGCCINETFTDVNRKNPKYTPVYKLEEYVPGIWTMEERRGNAFLEAEQRGFLFY
ncbi:hypothetical protein AVEN_4392-1 [Araneus ventricosus]|uniref:Secreted protein n=1 Tax=Araneus ventricosus TaxID=182803 RepID=A0A4Y2TN39_ARAVE|nr:hypothetical protein AVEN_4392-1 [Araneus ventricosus]